MHMTCHLYVLLIKRAPAICPSSIIEFQNLFGQTDCRRGRRQKTGKKNDKHQQFVEISANISLISHSISSEMRPTLSYALNEIDSYEANQLNNRKRSEYAGCEQFSIQL